MTASTVTELLGQLKDQGGIRSFFRLEEGEPVLYSGVLFEREASVRQVFATGVNLIDDTQLEVQTLKISRSRFGQYPCCRTTSASG